MIESRKSRFAASGTTCFVVLSFLCMYFPVFLNEAKNIIRAGASTGSMTRLLYNYSGGFIRRGLLGEIISYFVDHGYSGPFIVGIVIGTAFLAFLFLSVPLLAKTVEMDIIFLFLFSPALCAFFFTHTLGHLFRSDIFILLAFVGTIYLCLWRQKKRQTMIEATRVLFWRTQVCFWSIYMVCYLISENALFYLFLQVMILIITLDDPREIKITLYLACVALIASLVLAFVGVIDESGQAEMMDYFSRHYQDFHKPTVDFLSLNFFPTMISTTKRLFYSDPLYFAQLAVLLAILPAVMVFIRHNLAEFLRTFLLKRSSKIGFFVAFVSPFGIYLIGTDTGRWAFMIGMTYLLSLVAIIRIRQLRAEGEREREQHWNYPYLLFLYFFVSTWQIVYPGEVVMRWNPKFYNDVIRVVLEL